MLLELSVVFCRLSKIMLRFWENSLAFRWELESLSFVGLCLRAFRPESIRTLDDSFKTLLGDPACMFSVVCSIQQICYLLMENLSYYKCQLATFSVEVSQPQLSIHQHSDYIVNSSQIRTEYFGKIKASKLIIIIIMIQKIKYLRSGLVLTFRTVAFASKYLNPHINKIIQDKLHIYQPCLEKIEQISHQSRIGNKEGNESREQEIRTQANMLFRIYSLPDVLQGYREQLCQQVLTGQVKSQSELDRICGIITKQLKYDKNFQLSQLGNMKKNEEAQKLEFDNYLLQLKTTGRSFSLSEESKKLRDLFVTIDSKQIYQRLKELQKTVEMKEEKKQQKEENQFWDKIYSIKPRLLAEECNDSAIYQQHLKITQGKLRFRFPPQPNGYLHIGHIKSIRINFQTAKRHGGICFLRYDDTNPQTQSHEYIDNILKNVRWLGYEPDHITYASDYFPQMLDFAIYLIKQGHAYVCDSPQSDIETERKNKQFNRYRDRPVEESLSMFPNLKQGQTLRLKLDPASKNPTLRDPIIYRIKEHSHPRTGNKYRVYPIYDFAHCICDSLEHIDYSLCSLEFQVRRELYYKILDLLKLYKPIVWQYSRLNVEGSVISKRKIKALIEAKVIDSWTDPRLLTIGGLINRGYKPAMLINFIDKVNASRSGNENVVQFSLLEREMRQWLYKNAQKSMMVLNPRSIEIQNMQESDKIVAEVELYTDQRKETRTIHLCKRVWIEKEEDVNKLGKIIVLKYFGAFEVTHVSEQLLKVRKVAKDIKQIKEEGLEYRVVHWISEADCCREPVVIYNQLLENEKVNENSKVVIKGAAVPKNLIEKRGDIEKYWQMERIGYFKFDENGQLIRCTALN